ncbi:MAG: type III pantothenate kinase [Alphaproteobacteria bacterium]
MLLAIDAGNTNLVFALFDNTLETGKKLASWRISTDIRRTSDEYAVWLTQLMRLKGFTPETVTAGMIASVVPPLDSQLLLLFREYFSVEPQVVGQMSLPLQVNIDHPQSVGADRLVNAVAAHHYYQGPLVVVDLGTATTFDVVDEAGNYCGGVIAPGVHLSMEALHRAAAKLPKVEVAMPPRVVGRNTIHAMQSGLYWGYAGMMEGIISRISRELALPIKVIATGGLARLYAENISIFDAVDDDLTIKGLWLLHQWGVHSTNSMKDKNNVS